MKGDTMTTDPQATLSRAAEEPWTIVVSREERYLETLEEMVAIGRRRNDPTLAIAVSVEMLGLLTAEVRRLRGIAAVAREWSDLWTREDHPEALRSLPEWHCSPCGEGPGDHGGIERAAAILAIGPLASERPREDAS